MTRGNGADLMGDHVNSRAALWQSVRAIMVREYGGENMKRLATDTGVGLATIARIKDQQTSIGIDVLDRIAARFNVSAWQLLVPGFNPAAPPTLQPVSERERQLYDRLIKAAKDFAAEPLPDYGSDNKTKP